MNLTRNGKIICKSHLLITSKSSSTSTLNFCNKIENLKKFAISSTKNILCLKKVWDQLKTHQVVSKTNIKLNNHSHYNKNLYNNLKKQDSLTLLKMLSDHPTPIKMKEQIIWMNKRMIMKKKKNCNKSVEIKISNFSRTTSKS